MRQNKERGGGSKADEKEDKIVRRELAQVFTNGTIVDPSYLTSDEANHCVAIKVSLEPLSGDSDLFRDGIETDVRRRCTMRNAKRRRLAYASSTPRPASSICARSRTTPVELSSRRCSARSGPKSFSTPRQVRRLYI